MLFADGRCGDCRQQGVQGWRTVGTAADDFDFILLAHPQSHDRHQAVERGDLAVEVQFGVAGETLGGLAQ
ncbi:hypothetical protein D3C80_866690 [compost metagenome]